MRPFLGSSEECAGVSRPMWPRNCHCTQMSCRRMLRKETVKEALASSEVRVKGKTVKPIDTEIAIKSNFKASVAAATVM